MGESSEDVRAADTHHQHGIANGDSPWAKDNTAKCCKVTVMVAWETA
ncbi:hypothetical protein PC116_g11919 [Phytophthora cactorum]|uniref:Uncharacterized protein n=1 Tax=Phytophthora cactorum TaxID=29920 RepID=A0A8T1GMQ7_9STRA|nr:hypothetical protein Pcac1_g914 [Phytophthora cactorum]KAG2837065.1 hypothetical protein PC112_g5062 [Phytophthora cactorum]KAG2859442.1 hypothetical protein PC113_g8940 [Phytophthora cactorum]KAG2922238.1 hypothetical protein PC114_g5338 [Phytophthora cactorum]KAG2926488.1 hypothetical protein PC115_g7889 [Phytophthora cactorum]